MGPGAHWTKRLECGPVRGDDGRGFVNGKATLEQRLLRLASAGIAGPAGQMLRAPGPGAILSRLLSEVDETILPRRVHVNGAGGGPVTFSAANGRLLRIEAAVVEGDFDDLVNTEFDGSDLVIAERLKGLFEAILDGGDTMTIRREAEAGELDPGRAGLSAATLAEAWDTPLGTHVRAGEAGDSIDTFLGGIQDIVTAWMLTGVETEESESAGDEEKAEELLAFAEARRETGEALRHSAETMGEQWVFLALHRAEGSGDVTVILSVDKILLYLTADRDALGELSDIWRDAAVTD